MEAAAAEAHKHELWLRELECFAIVEGREVRLDADYHPPRQPPDWVPAVEARLQPMLDAVLLRT